MLTKQRFPELSKKLGDCGVSFITDIRAEGRGAAIANTYFLDMGDQYYMIDAACGKKRLRRIRDHLQGRNCDLLATHSHLDHSANSGAAVNLRSRIIFHPLVEHKIDNLQRNYTEITPAMINAFGVEGFFGRTGMLRPSMRKKLLFIQKHFPSFFSQLMKLVSLALLRINIGHIHSPHANVQYLSYADQRDLIFDGIHFSGWDLGNGIFALETPGHQNDHLAFYIPGRRIMFAGDLINFLNPNDILDGSIKDTHAGLQRMKMLADAGGINILALSHALPIVGSDQAVSYIRTIIAQQDEIFATVAGIVDSCSDKNDFAEIIAKIYRHESELMKRVLKINYPRSVSFIDVYVYLYLQEFLHPDID